MSHKLLHYRARDNCDCTGVGEYRLKLLARRYASAVLTVIVCPSVCLSVSHKSVFY